MRVRVRELKGEIWREERRIRRREERENREREKTIGREKRGGGEID